MGEVAEQMLDGTLCQHCGTYLGTPESYPKTCRPCRVEGSNAVQATHPNVKVRCEQCNKMVKRIGLKDHQRDAHGVKP